jgi:tight adherence protein C
MPALYGLLAAFFCGLGLLAIPMLRDEGPVERLGGRAGGSGNARERHSVVMQLVNGLAARLGPRLAPTMRASRRAALEHRIDYAGRPGGLTVTRFIGLQASLAVLLGLGVGGLLVLLGSSVIFLILLAVIGWFGPAVWLSRAGRLRQEAIEKALPDFLDILAVSVRAGLG